MLHDFLTANREELITRCRAKVAQRCEPTATPGSIDHGVPLFLEQLVGTLRAEQLTPTRADAHAESSPAPTAIGRAAALHGAELLRLGYRIDQVVHDYGDVCQSVTGLAVEQDIPISTDEFRTLNRCLDNAIADAVTSFGAARRDSLQSENESLQQRLVRYAAEHGRLIEIAIQSYAAIKSGNVGLAGATGALHVHALEELQSLPERGLPEIRVKSPDLPEGTF
jgi:hypothetical protein